MRKQSIAGLQKVFMKVHKDVAKFTVHSLAFFNVALEV